ncbi:MAG: hypothetical protein VW518_00435, partial [Burkholderiaceae bacterium]
HLHRMYSLQKVYDGDKLPFEGGIITPKLDGAAVSLRYSEGELVLALTRGDGIKGVDITEKMRHLVPDTISRTDEVQITGEVVAPLTIANARNYAAGSLNLKDINEFTTRNLRFVAYDVFPKQCETWTEDLNLLTGFSLITDSDWAEYPQDGKVYRVNEESLFESMGYTSHHPRGAYAYKVQQKGVVTKLLDVVWKVGKSGVVSPVALLEPVVINDATVSRATLHNIAYIEALNLEIGCDVEVIRSGEIIPRIVRRVT